MGDALYTLTALQLLLGAFVLAAALGTLGVRRGDSRRGTVAAVVAVVYTALVLALTVLPITFGRPEFSMASDPHWRNSVNLVAFRTIELYLRSDIVGIARVNLLGNVALLAPLGVLAPLFWKRLDRWSRMALFAGASSVAIEMLQFGRTYIFGMPGRSVDVDDVILNTAGALLGYAAFRAVRFVTRRMRRSAARPA